MTIFYCFKYGSFSLMYKHDPFFSLLFGILCQDNVSGTVNLGYLEVEWVTQL